MENYIAMNRFKIKPGRESEFENIWRMRETHLDEIRGFKSFRLLKGPANDEHILYVSHSIWDSRLDFENWKRSEAFKKAHSGSSSTKGIYLGHPEFEGFKTVI